MLSLNSVFYVFNPQQVTIMSDSNIHHPSTIQIEKLAHTISFTLHFENSNMKLKASLMGFTKSTFCQGLQPPAMSLWPLQSCSRWHMTSSQDPPSGDMHCHTFLPTPSLRALTKKQAKIFQHCPFFT